MDQTAGSKIMQDRTNEWCFNVHHQNTGRRTKSYSDSKLASNSGTTGTMTRPVAVPWSSVIQTALWLPVGLPWSAQLPCQTNVWSREQSAPFPGFGQSVTGQGRFRAAMPMWRLTDNSDSISGQRRRRKYQRPTERERRAIIDAHLSGDEWKRDFKTSERRHG